MKKIITIPTFIALCLLLFASCSRKPVPGFTRAKSKGQYAHRISNTDNANDMATVDTATTTVSEPTSAEARLGDNHKEESAGKGAVTKEQVAAARSQLKDLDRSQLNKRQQKLLNKLDKRLEKIENRPTDTHARGAIGTGLGLILAGIILMILGMILNIFYIFGVIFLVVGLIFLLIGLIDSD